LVSVHGLRLHAASAAAITNAFRAQTVFKGHLHRALWDASLALAALLGLRGAWGAR
jgi:hypothetical protein